MMTGNSRQVTSAQQDCHPELLQLVERHRKHQFQKPIADFNQRAFQQAEQQWLAHGGPLILDSGCGVGDSTRFLAEQHPDHLVMGLDRSVHRLQRQRPDLPANALLLRTDLVDFWRLAASAGWQPDRHFLFYPNPYPKPSQLSRRFHAHPVFPAMVTLSKQLEARSNWKIYLQELQTGLAAYGIHSLIEPIEADSPAVSAFERKYRASQQPLWKLITQS
ncbi:tRNA (guanine(46)-N(7))-methyltransferase TrmB [Nitrincola sp. A-D6]|uniref:tRNA (guanine(46)-N(7))-methyltransferase TrmB n=1 Tax=Nitrincola sp. A-D6 TaxID=1545442 RepID=UPI001F18BB2C|nr:tRNA (guanine-N(7)-)-methyltransferase [Nitrincola sp. A-D6]